jgi:abhydrolase domain-containing protein 6
VRMVASDDLMADAARIEAPTLLLWGDRDRTIPLRLAQQFAARLPQASLRVMADTFHEMATTRPADTAAIIHAFVTGARA